jgi:hypothetical protein
VLVAPFFNKKLSQYPCIERIFFFKKAEKSLLGKETEYVDVSNPYGI